MTSVRIELPPKLVPVFEGEAMYRGAYGGRGSAKTRSFAKMAAVRGLILSQAGQEGVIVCAREFMNSLADSSMAEVKAAIASEPWLAERYELGETFIRTIDSRITFLFVGLRHNLGSLKSKARILLLWVDEAEPVTDEAWDIIVPTIREEGAEIWVTWNPERKNSGTHKRFRLNPPDGAKIAQMNWQDNPFFPAILNKTRLEDMAKRPDQYAHVWEGEFVSARSGAYFAHALALARQEKRISVVAPDPLMPFKAFWDIGVRDATAIWIAQWVGREIRLLDYYEAQHQPLATHIGWMRSRGYENAECYLPHDGSHEDAVSAVRFEDHLRSAGFKVRTIANQGKGAALKRVEALRRLFPSIWIDINRCAAGIDALGWYHEKVDEVRNIGLGPEHDWASHGADAGGLMAVAYEAPKTADKAWKFTPRKVA